jgi:DNA-binding protein HU-beta
MNKQELIDQVAASTGLSKAEATAAVDAVFATIAQEIASGDTVRVPGFGNFGVADRAARQGRNPATGEPVAIPARRLPKFGPARTLKDAVNDENTGIMSVGKGTTPP